MHLPAGSATPSTQDRVRPAEINQTLIISSPRYTGVSGSCTCSPVCSELDVPEESEVAVPEPLPVILSPSKKLNLHHSFLLPEAIHYLFLSLAGGGAFFNTNSTGQLAFLDKMIPIYAVLHDSSAIYQVKASLGRTAIRMWEWNGAYFLFGNEAHGIAVTVEN